MISTGLSNVAGANFGGGTNPGNLVANGVTFSFVANNTPTLLLNGITINPGNWASAYPNAALSTMPGAFGTILDNQFDYDHQSPQANTSVDMTLTGLAIGLQYRIQFFASQNAIVLNPGFGPVDFQDTSGGSASPALSINKGEQYVVGTFTADGTSQVIRVNPSLNSGPLVSAFVIGRISEPPPPTDPTLSQDVVNADPDLDFGTVAGSGPFSESRTVRFVNNGPTNAIGITSATVTGDAPFSLTEVAIDGSAGVTLPQTLAVGSHIDFTVTASLALPASGLAGSLAITTDAIGQDQNLPISGNFGGTPPLPPVTDEAPAAGKRVRVTPPEWAGTNVYHTLYLPTDWVAGNTYPVIVEWAPNSSGGFAGTVEDTHLGFYQSGGAGFIWVTMPFPTTATSPASNAITWWGDSQNTAADYTRINLARILENYGGDPAAVFATGFSRGSLAIGHIGHWNDQIADIWLGYLPLGQLDGFNWTTEGDEAARFARMSGRASFVTYGENDGFSNVPASPPAGITAMQNAGFPV
ncbi:MAG: hypothetical protein ACO3JG_15445, partial [Luteolibacter sp.]